MVFGKDQKPNHPFKKGHPKYGNAGFKKGNKDYKLRKKVGMSKGQTNSGSFKIGSESRFWKGGIAVINEGLRKSLEYRLWREAVLKRDNYICIWCGSKEKVQADHIKTFSEFPELRFAIDNGRTLCRKCHEKRHYGEKQDD